MCQPAAAMSEKNRRRSRRRRRGTGRRRRRRRGKRARLTAAHQAQQGQGDFSEGEERALKGCDHTRHDSCSARRRHRRESKVRKALPHVTRRQIGCIYRSVTADGIKYHLFEAVLFYFFSPLSNPPIPNCVASWPVLNLLQFESCIIPFFLHGVWGHRRRKTKTTGKNRETLNKPKAGPLAHAYPPKTNTREDSHARQHHGSKQPRSNHTHIARTIWQYQHPC